MKPLKTIVVVAAGFVFLVGLLYVTFASAADRPGADLDRFQQCKIDCNEIYGGTDILSPGLSGAGALGYSNCVLSCDRRYWKDFDRQFEDM